MATSDRRDAHRWRPVPLPWRVAPVLFLVATVAGLARAEERPSNLNAVDVLTAARRASGAPLRQGGDRLRLSGRYSAAGQPGTFSQMLDTKADRYRTSVTTGGLVTSEGRDVGAWVTQNGIVTRIDLPALEQDARSRAFLWRSGWQDPAVGGELVRTAACESAGVDCVRIRTPAGSVATLWFDRRTHLPQREVLEVDGGEETTTLADWRRVGSSLVPFLRTISDGSGASVTFAAEKATFVRRVSGDLARPSPVPHGRLEGGRPARVPFAFTAFDRGHIVVPATVGSRTVRLIFDSGGANYFTPESARELGLAVAGGVNIGGVGEGAENGGYARVAEMAIGSAKLVDEAALVGPLPYPAVRPRAELLIAGLTGFEYLSEFRTTIDYARREIAFAPFASRAPRGVTVPFRSDGHSIYVQAEVDGVGGFFRLDTGDAGALTVFKRFADGHGLFSAGGRATRLAGGVGGAIAAKEAKAATFRIAGATIANIPVTISDTSAGAFFSRSLAGNLGSAILSRFTLTFDYRAGTLTFLPNDDLSAPFARDRSGLSLNQTDAEAIDVLSVAKGSPAELAGIRAGDRIVEVDGRSVAAAGLGLFDLSPLRFGRATFRLSLIRDGAQRSAIVTPRDLDR